MKRREPRKEKPAKKTARKVIIFSVPDKKFSVFNKTVFVFKTHHFFHVANEHTHIRTHTHGNGGKKSCCINEGVPEPLFCHEHTPTPTPQKLTHIENQRFTKIKNNQISINQLFFENSGPKNT